MSNREGKADFVTTGAWSKKALAEAKIFRDAGEAATSKESNFSTIPDRSTWNLRDGAKFVHICENETIGGVEFKETPVGLPDGAVLVADRRELFEQTIRREQVRNYLRWGAKEHSVCWYGNCNHSRRFDWQRVAAHADDVGFQHAQRK